MTLNPRIQATVDLLDERIDNLQKIKTMLLAEYGVTENGGQPSETIRSMATPLPKIPRKPPGRGSERKKELMSYLLKAGPTRRSVLSQQAGMPAGTVSYLLHDKTTFRRLGDGRWDVCKDVRARQ